MPKTSDFIAHVDRCCLKACHCSICTAIPMAAKSHITEGKLRGIPFLGQGENFVDFVAGTDIGFAGLSEMFRQSACRVEGSGLFPLQPTGLTVELIVLGADG